MREKLLQLMKNEGLTSSRLAEILDIQPSGISHLLSGRNKPGFDLLQKMLRRFPRINPDWLLLDSEQMYRDSTDPEFRCKQMHPQTNTQAPESNASKQYMDTDLTSARRTEVMGSNETTEVSKALQPLRNDVERIVVLYADHTFESFVPKIRE